MNLKKISDKDTTITTTYRNTLPDSHYGHLFDREGIEIYGRSPTFEEYVQVELTYPYMIFYKLYSDTEALALQGNVAPFEINLFLGEGYLAETTLNSTHISLRSLKKRETEYLIEQVESNENEHQFFDLLEWLDERLEEAPEQIDFIEEYIDSFDTEKEREIVKELVIKYPPDIRMARRYTSRKLNRG